MLLTEEYVGSVIYYCIIMQQNKSNEQVQKKIKALQENYIINLAHIETKDTTR